MPLETVAGEEAQVDFGYVGRWYDGERWVKIWAFCMVLSYSRKAFYCLVRSQKVRDFLWCHILAFEYFGGACRLTKLDNLKAGVITPDFYEPLIQEQYQQMLDHYGSSALPCRVRRGQDKGKVESGIKYLKGNFIKGVDHRDLSRLGPELDRWVEEICNRRVHGTTRKVPGQVFSQVEKSTLQPLPAQRFEIYQVEERKVNMLGHILFRYNYYSVPHTYAGKGVTVRSNGHILRLYDARKQICMHTVCADKGRYISQEEHRPPYKRKKTREWYDTQVSGIGPDCDEVYGSSCAA